MDFKAKRKAKKLAKVYFTAAYAMLILFVASLVSILVYGFKTPDASSILFVLPLIFMIASLGISFIGQHHLNKRYRYKAAIKLYRENRFFTKVLDSLRAGDYDAAVDAYQMIVQGDKKKFLYGFFIGMTLNSTDPKRLEKAKDKFDGVRGYYDPANVVFN